LRPAQFSCTSARRHRVGETHDLVHRRRLRDRAGRALRRLAEAIELRAASSQPLAVEALGDDGEEALGIDRLGDEVVGPALHGVDGGLDGGERRHHDDRHLGAQVLDGAEQIEPGLAAEAQVEEREVGRLLLDRREGGAPRGDPAGGVTGGLEQARQRGADGRLVIDDQDATHTSR
jgi:hypothetical protein